MKKHILFVDTETGGLNPHEDSILSFGAALIYDGAIVDTFYTLIREEKIIVNPAALKINGLSVEKVQAEGVPPLMAVKKLVAFLNKNGLKKNVQFAAHNAPFDMPFVKRMFDQGGQDFNKVFSYRPLCTQTGALLLDLSGRISLPGGSASLDNLTKFFHIDLDREAGHNALQDAIAGAKVLIREMELIGGKPA